MKNISIVMFMLLTMVTFSSATTVYEDGEDGTTEGWVIRNNSSNNPFANIYSNSQESRVIHLDGGSRMLGGFPGTSSAWNNRAEKTITWKMNVYDRYTIYVLVNTTHGLRYLFYNDLPQRINFHNGTMVDENGRRIGILHGLGGYQHSEYKNVWRTYTRDLEADLKDADPDNELISVDGFIYNGSEAFIDDIILYNPTENLYGDGESGVANWTVSDNDPAGATITTTADPENAQGTVINLQGSAQNNAYSLGAGAWNNTTEEILQWKSRFHEYYEVRVNVQTTQGARTMLYVNNNTYTPSGGIIENGQTIWHDLGGWSIIGRNGWENAWNEYNGPVNNVWQTVTRDIAQDIRNFEPNNSLISVNSFEVRGSGLIDDVKMLARPVILNPNDDVVYEDAEDGSVEGWHVYDNTPAGATITNVNDVVRGSNVIELNGAGLNNGFEIGRRTGEGQWNNRDHGVIRWSMNYIEAFSIYVALETTNGARYMNYEPRDDDRGRSGNYIRIGLGSNANDGTWQTFTRNLQNDLEQFDPGNELVAIHAFLIRGSGRLDDIYTMLSYEETVYEDAEDQTTEGWSIFANASGAATITNVLDNDQQSRVIALQGSGKGDGYMLGARDGANAWNDRANSIFRWSMNYGEDFTIYISTETTNGRRYLTYTPRDDDRGLSGQYVLLGLGADSDNGTWQTFTRNLANDLASAEAGNELISVNAFMIRGSGRIDDMVMLPN